MADHSGHTHGDAVSLGEPGGHISDTADERVRCEGIANDLANRIGNLKPTRVQDCRFDAASAAVDGEGERLSVVG